MNQTDLMKQQLAVETQNLLDQIGQTGVAFDNPEQVDQVKSLLLQALSNAELRGRQQMHAIYQNG